MALFVFHGLDKPGALELRKATRPAHLAWLEAHAAREDRRADAGGGWRNAGRSMLVFEAETLGRGEGAVRAGPLRPRRPLGRDQRAAVQLADPAMMRGAARRADAGRARSAAFAQPGSAPIPTEPPRSDRAVRPAQGSLSCRSHRKALRADDRSMEHRAARREPAGAQDHRDGIADGRVVAGARVLDVASGGGYLAMHLLDARWRGRPCRHPQHARLDRAVSRRWSPTCSATGSSGRTSAG